MADISLDLTALNNAIDRLSEGIARYERDRSDTQIPAFLAEAVWLRDQLRQRVA